MEYIINLCARPDQRFLIPDVPDDEGQSAVLESAHHGHLAGFVPREDDDLLGFKIQQLPDQLIPPGAGAACHQNSLVTKHTLSLLIRI
ncbi:hypothetical protein D3C81_2039330 [compost metagenome]